MRKLSIIMHVVQTSVTMARKTTTSCDGTSSGVCGEAGFPLASGELVGGAMARVLNAALSLA